MDPYNEEIASGWAPFRIVILAELEPRDEFALRCPRERLDATLTLGSLDRLVRTIEPTFRLPLHDRTTGKETDFDVRWHCWNDIAGAGLLASPAMLALRDAHASLSRGSSRTDPSQYVSRVLPNVQGWLAEEARTAEKRKEAPTAAASSSPSQDRLGALFDMVDLPTNAVERHDTTQYARIADGVNAVIADVLCEALAHPEYRRLRRVWQSLRTLALCLGDNGLVNISVECIPSDTDEVEESLDRVDCDLVIWESPFEACARDTARLNRLADWAARHSIPVIATLGPDWMTAPTARGSVPRPTDAGRSLLNAVGRREQSRWLTLALNDLCEGEPIAGEIVRDGPSCSQPRDAESSWTFVPAAVALGAMTVRALVRGGEPFATDGSASTCRSGAIYEIPSPSGPIGIGTRWLCNAEGAQELMRSGVATLVPTKNRDTVQVISVPTAYRPINAAGDLADPASSLADQVLTGRIAKVIGSVLSRCQRNLDRASVLRQLESELSSLFPKAPPVGPMVEVSEEGGCLGVSVRPRRYGGLTLDCLNLSIRLD